MPKLKTIAKSLKKNYIKRTLLEIKINFIRLNFITEVFLNMVLMVYDSQEQ